MRPSPIAGLLLALVGALSACQANLPASSSSPTAGAQAPGQASGAVGLPATVAEAGVAAGLVTDAAGKPLANVNVDIEGTSSENAGISSYSVKTDASGHYRKSGLAPATNYKVRAYQRVPYNGKTYPVRFAPTQGDYDQEFDSTQGIARDFVWKLSGPVAGATAGSDNPASFYGASLAVYAFDPYAFANLADKMPKQGTLTIKLVPTGPLIDGSVGQPIALSGALKSTDRIIDSKDVPIGSYSLTASVQDASGAVVPLRVLAGGVALESAFATSASISFEPSSLATVPFNLGGLTDGVSIYIIP